MCVCVCVCVPFLSYRTPIWGFSGHLQTVVYGLWGRFADTGGLQGERRSVVVPDGSTVFYDLFEPPAGVAQSEVILVVPGGLHREHMTSHTT